MSHRCSHPIVATLPVLLACLASGPALASEPTAEGVDFRATVRAAKDRVFPAVVFIECIREGFEEGKKQSREVAGSGVLISAGGEALTNWHVVEKAADIRCLLYDGRAMHARVVGSDKDTDLALLQLEVPAGSGDLPHGVLGDSTHLEEGEFVMAMGAPWGLSRSVSIGIISCTRRFLPESSEYSLWIQTDCAISPGNSGGPVVNTAGEIIGLTARGSTMGGDMGFAVPAETIKTIVPRLREHGCVNWSWYGLQLQPLRDFNRDMYFEGTEGVIVAATDPDSPARQAGLQPRDRIVTIGSRPVVAQTEEDVPALRSWLGQQPKGAPVEFVVQRGDERLTVAITPREKGRVEGEEYDCKRWDMTVKTINQFDNPALHYYRPQGVFVFGLKYPGNAAAAGLMQNDIVVKIDGQEVQTLDDVRTLHARSLENVGTKPRIVLTVLRGGLTRQVVLDCGRDYERE